MPLALLLSPDDQAVSAITAVLEEMSVVCERPLDGVSAAKKLNSNTFDLVLVDCENLPAAKLIFDVCRRGKGGHNPVPIAIVDGRAGLPTAFRLGAELILTKPVAKDQARNTIRTAVSRVKKEDPTRAADQGNEVQASAPDSGTFAPNADQSNQESFAGSAVQAMPQELALAATATADSSQLSSFSDPLPVVTLSAPALATLTTSAAPAVEVPTVLTETKPSVSSWAPSDDPVLADLERTEAEEDWKSQLPGLMPDPGSQSEKGSSKQDQSDHGQSKPDQKSRGPLVAVFVLVLTCAGLYVAWMYEPGFQALAQPQVDRILGLVGVAHHPQPAAPTPVKPAAQPTQVPLTPATKPSAAIAIPAAVSGAAPAAQPSDPAHSSATPASATPASATVPAAASATVVPGTAGTVASPVGKSTPRIDVDKAAPSPKGVNQPPADQHPVNKDNTDPKNIAAAGASYAPVPGEETATVLSSQGADKRLMHSVQPNYPAGATDSGGTMLLKAVVDEDGKVTGARVIEGNAVLANAAIDAVKQWRYRPYVRDGKAQPFQTVVQVDFQRP